MRRITSLSFFILLLTLGGRAGAARVSAGPTERVSISSDGVGPNGPSHSPAISNDGRYVAFESGASNLVEADTNGAVDIFLRDRETGSTTRLSTHDNGQGGNCTSAAPSISGGGRTIAFHSCAFNLVNGDSNNVQDVFVRDRQTNRTERVSIASNGIQANDASSDPAISGDSRYVAFWSYASNLAAADSNGQPDVFVRDRQLGQTFWISVNSQGIAGNGSSRKPAISDNGRFVVFESTANNLAAGDADFYQDIYLYDMGTGNLERVSVSDGEAAAQGDSWSPSVSADGRYVAFVSLAANLVGDDHNGYPDVFVRDRQEGRTLLVSRGSGGQVNVFEDEQEPAISDDGRRVAFRSRANNLVAGDNNGVADIFVRELDSETTTRASITSEGREVADESGAPALSYDGRFVAFASLSDNLVTTDNNDQWDIFVHDRAEPPPPPPPPPPSPSLSVNYYRGAPGSFFTVSGSNFPAGQPVTVIINGRTLSESIAADATGQLRFLLSTAGAEAGIYGMRVTAGIMELTVSFWLEPAFPLRLQEDTGPVVAVPAGIALPRGPFLPVTFRRGAP